MNKISKKIAFFTFLALVVLCFSLFSNDAKAGPGGTPPTTSHNVSGWAWSYNTGWISFNSRDCDIDGNGVFGDAGAPAGCPTSGVAYDYGVSLDPTTGNLTGYGWSDRIGWVSFNSSDTAQCGGVQAHVDVVGGGVVGFARALAGNTPESGSWNGCMKLSDGPTGSHFKSPDTSGAHGVTYVPATGDIVGYAWGYVNVGWIKFHNVKVDLGTPFVDLQISAGGPQGKSITISNPTTATPVTLYITTKDLVSCTNTITPPPPYPLGTFSNPANAKWNAHMVSPTAMGPFTPDAIPATSGTYLFALICKGVDGNNYASSASATVSTTPSLVLEVGVPGTLPSSSITVHNPVFAVAPKLYWKPFLMQSSPFTPSSAPSNNNWDNTMSNCSLSGNGSGSAIYPIPTQLTSYNYYLDCIDNDGNPQSATATLTIDPAPLAPPVIEIKAKGSSGTTANPVMVNNGDTPTIDWAPVSPTQLASCKIGVGNTGVWISSFSTGLSFDTATVGTPLGSTQGSFVAPPIYGQETYSVECLDINNQKATDSVVVDVFQLCPDGTAIPPSGACPSYCPDGSLVPTSGICKTVTYCPDGITPVLANGICPTIISSYCKTHPLDLACKKNPNTKPKYEEI